MRKRSICAGFAAVFAIASPRYVVQAAVAAPSRTIAVRRMLSPRGATDIMMDSGKIVLVRMGARALLGAPPFDMPERYRLTTVSTRHVKTAFSQALATMRCGKPWRRERLTRDEAFGEIGEWRSFRTARCDRSEIVSKGRKVFESIQLSHHLLIFVTAIQ